MEREYALAVLRVMVNEYATAVAWVPGDIHVYREEALTALEVLGVDRAELERR